MNVRDSAVTISSGGCLTPRGDSCPGCEARGQDLGTAASLGRDSPGTGGVRVAASEVLGE